MKRDSKKKLHREVVDLKIDKTKAKEKAMKSCKKCGKKSCKC